MLSILRAGITFWSSASSCLLTQGSLKDCLEALLGPLLLKAPDEEVNGRVGRAVDAAQEDTDVIGDVIFFLSCIEPDDTEGQTEEEAQEREER